jgi:NAD(P)-dependent dehydrogenase (short-subunit alcohol dehydrogenase family)
MEYAAAKGAIISLTRSLAEQLASRGVRVNAILPGPIWTPDLPLTMKPQELPDFGRATLLGRPGHPSEVGPAFVFLASQDASYITGQVIQPNGGVSDNF